VHVQSVCLRIGTMSFLSVFAINDLTRGCAIPGLRST
jgi:hypothetical protein